MTADIRGWLDEVQQLRERTEAAHPVTPWATDAGIEFCQLAITDVPRLVAALRAVLDLVERQERTRVVPPSLASEIPTILTTDQVREVVSQALALGGDQLATKAEREDREAKIDRINAGIKDRPMDNEP